MRLMEAIIDANHRALAGDTNAGLHPADFADELPLVALTCIDVRLNSILPQVLGVPQEQFIWLRNAGNIITGPQSSTMRSLSLACAVKGGKEIAIIGHTDCQVGKTTTMQLLERLRAIGVERHMLPDNLNEFFGMFGSDRQNVIKGADIARQSPLIGPKIPIHGLLVDVESGKLDWLVNGYQAAETMTTRWNEFVKSAGQTVDKLKSLSDFDIGEMKFPDTKIGETVTRAEDWVAQKVQKLEMKPAAAPEPAAQKTPPTPPRIPLPPPIRPKVHLRRAPK
jgi:carbonic anhydrase